MAIVYRAPLSWVPKDDDGIYQGLHKGDGANAHLTPGVGIAGSVSADVEIHLEATLPGTIPAGTPKLEALAIGDGVTGDIEYKVEWAVVPATGGNDSDPSSATLNDENPSTNEDITWSTNDDDAWKKNVTALDAATIDSDDADKQLIIHVTIDYAASSVSFDTVWKFNLIWET